VIFAEIFLANTIDERDVVKKKLRFLCLLEFFAINTTFFWSKFFFEQTAITSFVPGIVRFETKNMRGSIFV
jgi:hypothetical protein